MSDWQEISPARVRVAAYLGDPAALQALAARGLAPPPVRRVRSPIPSQALRQWILGVGDVCAPADRVPLARRALAILLARIDHPHEEADLDELLAREKPWSVLRIVAGWGEHVLGEEEEDDDGPIRHVLVAGLCAWLRQTAN